MGHSPESGAATCPRVAGVRRFGFGWQNVRRQKPQAEMVKARMESLEVRSSSMNSMSDFAKTKARHSRWVGNSVRSAPPRVPPSAMSLAPVHA